MSGDGKSTSNVSNFRLTAAKAQSLVRELAAKSHNIIWTKHVRERMVERGIDTTDVLNILRKGFVDGDVGESDRPGEPKIKVTRKVGGREAGVVAVLISSNTRIRLLTAEWEDAR